MRYGFSIELTVVVFRVSLCMRFATKITQATAKMRQIQVAASKLPLTKYNKTHEVFHGYWKNASHQREFFQWFSHQNNFTSLDDWYNITSKDIHKAGGGTLINALYKGSLHKALKVAYPHHDWKIWKFKQVIEYSSMDSNKTSLSI